jgi:uncharacterized protein
MVSHIKSHNKDKYKEDSENDYLMDSFILSELSDSFSNLVSNSDSFSGGGGSFGGGGSSGGWDSGSSDSGGD